MTDVGVVCFDGFEELDAVGPYEVFGVASRAVECTVETATLDARERVTAAHGLRVEPDAALRDGPADRYDLLVVPGGGWNSGGDGNGAGDAREAARGPLPDWLAEVHAAGTTLAGVCTGGMILDAAGLLDGRPAVTHHGALEDLRAGAAEVVDARVVDDGDVLTCGGVTAGIDLALWLVEREFGETVADDVADTIEHERCGDVYRG